LSTIRTTITLPDAIKKKAEAIMEARDFGDLSGFLQQLIREEYERRHGPITMADEIREDPPAYKTQPQVKVPGTKKQKAKQN
jgi:hypothetical protein